MMEAVKGMKYYLAVSYNQRQHINSTIPLLSYHKDEPGRPSIVNQPQTVSLAFTFALQPPCS